MTTFMEDEHTTTIRSEIISALSIQEDSLRQNGRVEASQAVNNAIRITQSVPEDDWINRYQALEDMLMDHYYICKAVGMDDIGDQYEWAADTVRDISERRLTQRDYEVRARYYQDNSFHELMGNAADDEEVISVALPAHVLFQVKLIARHRGIRPSDVVSEAIADYLGRL